MKPEIEEVDVGDLIGAPFNPSDRLEEKALVDLKNSIDRYGVLSPIHIDANNNIADGHRRVQCAKDLGIQKIPAIRLDIGVSDAWAELNGSTRPINRKQWGVAFSNGLPLDNVPSKIQYNLAKMKEILGDEFDIVIKQNSVYIYSIARQLSSYVYGCADYEFMKKAILWMYKHNQQAMIRECMKNSIAADLIINAIENDLPIMRKFEIALHK